MRLSRPNALQAISRNIPSLGNQDDETGPGEDRWTGASLIHNENAFEKDNEQILGVLKSIALDVKIIHEA